MIYFDYTATTPIHPDVLDAYVKTQKTFSQTLILFIN